MAQCLDPPSTLFLRNVVEIVSPAPSRWVNAGHPKIQRRHTHYLNQRCLEFYKNPALGFIQMLIIADLVLVGMFVLGCVGFWRARRLFKRVDGDFLRSNYGITDADKASAASNFLAYVLVIFGLWLCIWVVVIWVLKIHFSLWVGVFLTITAVHYIASQRVRKKYGDEDFEFL